MARDTLQRQKKSRTYKQSLCECGDVIAYPPIIRNNKKVCRECANNIPPLHIGVVKSMKCHKCKKIVGRHGLVMRKGKLYCIECSKSF